MACTRWPDRSSSSPSTKSTSTLDPSGELPRSPGADVVAGPHERLDRGDKLVCRRGRRVQRPWRRIAHAVSWTPPTSTEIGVVAKSGLAAGLSWSIAGLVTGVPGPALAPLTALVVVQVSVRASVRTRSNAAPRWCSVCCWPSPSATRSSPERVHGRHARRACRSASPSSCSGSPRPRPGRCRSACWWCSPR